MTNPTGDALKASAALDEDKFCMTDKGPKLWKEIAQDAFDALEWHRSSLNPKWEEVRQAALSPVEQAPQPVASETHLVGCEDGDIPCNRCSGTGNLIKDWDRYVSAKTTEEVEECESDCLDCSGYGRFKADTPAPQARAIPTPTEAPPVESQAAEIARLRNAMLDAERMISTRPVKERCTGQNSHEVERFLSDVCDILREARHATSAALAAEGSAE